MMYILSLQLLHIIMYTYFFGITHFIVRCTYYTAFRFSISDKDVKFLKLPFFHQKRKEEKRSSELVSLVQSF